MAEVWVLTGGIGSGKSTIRETLEELGASTIDADRVGHGILEPGSRGFAAVAERWPHVIVDGRVDRSALAAIVFSDPAELGSLEAITHPAISGAIAQRIADAGDEVVVIEISVAKDLAGAGWNRTIVADLDENERLRRLVDRGMSESDVRRRMANQPSSDGWRARGRWIISTAGSREEVAAEVRRLWNQVIQPSASKP
jgi:dephospho-CoA kinase